MTTTTDAAAIIGVSTQRLHDLAFIVPELIEIRTGGGSHIQNVWNIKALRLTKLIQENFGTTMTGAARIAVHADFDGKRTITLTLPE